MNPSIAQGCGNTAVTIPFFVFVIDGYDFRFSHFVFVCALHPAFDDGRKSRGEAERLKEEYPECVFASVFELPAFSALASLVFQNQGLQVF